MGTKRALTRSLHLSKINAIAKQTICVPKAEIQHKTPTVKKTTIIPPARYGGRNLVTMMPGVGIGPELMGYVREVFEVAGAPVDFEIHNVDEGVDEEEDEQNLKNLVTSIRRNGLAIKGNIETKSLATAIHSRNIEIRNELDLYVMLVRCKTYSGVRSKHKNVDVIVVRQNIEGEYALLEHESAPGVVESLKIITRDNSRRIARFAFELAKRENRKKVHTIHKANIMKVSDGLFLEVAKEVAKDYPEIKHEAMIVDNCCMQLVSNPHNFDVMITTNLYGSICCNVLSGLIGGPGLTAGQNIGDHFAIFEAGTRNSGTEIAGKNIANPVAILNASVHMLEYLGHHGHAKVIRDAIIGTLCTDKIHTPDLGGTATSTDVVNNIKQRVDRSTVSW